jgi:hypothetical protein
MSLFSLAETSPCCCGPSCLEVLPSNGGDPYTQCATLSHATASARPTGCRHCRLTSSRTDNRRPRSRIKRGAYASVQLGSLVQALPTVAFVRRNTRVLRSSGLAPAGNRPREQGALILERPADAIPGNERAAQPHSPGDVKFRSCAPPTPSGTSPLKFGQRLQSTNRSIANVYLPERGIASVVAVAAGDRRQAEVALSVVRV